MTEWQILKDGTTAEPNLVDVEVHKTADPFASYGIAYIRDPDGTAFDEYYRGRRVDFESRPSLNESANLVTDGGSAWELLQTLTDSSSRIRQIGFSPDSSMLVAGGDDVRVYDTETWDVLQTFSTSGSSPSAMFSLTGDWIFYGDGSSLVVRETDSWSVVQTLSTSSNVVCIDHSPIDGTVAVGQSGGTVQIFTTDDWAKQFDQNTINDFIHDVSYAPDGSYLVYGGLTDSNIYIVDTSDYSQSDTIDPVGSSYYALNFSPDSDWLCTSMESITNRVEILNTADWSQAHIEPSEGVESGELEDSHSNGFSPDNTQLAYTISHGSGIDPPYEAYVLDTSDWSEITQLTSPSGQMWTLTYSQDGEFLAFGGEDNNVYIHSAEEVADLTYTAQQTCFVVERREIQRNGHDMLEVECWSIDHLLNRNVVTEDISDTAISSVLETLVTDYTPVGWDASKVEVFNDVSITRSFEGMRTGSVIQELAAKSANEQFGVDLDGDFYFQSRETGQATRNISNSQWFDYDIFELGQESVNEAQINYDSGNAAIVYDDAADKQFLQNELSTAGPVTLKEEQSWDQITSRENAIDKATEIVEDRSTTLTGTVTTFGLLNSEPGNIINVTIDPISVNDTFRIAELAYYWARDETIVTILEKRENQTDDLIRLNDRLTRTETRTADRTVTPRRVIIPDERTVSLDLSGIVDGQGVNNVTATTSGLSLLSGLWVIGDANNNHDVTELRVGTDSSEPTTTDDSIASVGSGSVSLTNNGVGGVTASASVSISEDASIVEVGLFAQDLTTGTEQLIARGTFPAQSVSNGASISVSMTINYETASGSRGVFTETAQSALSDLLSGDVTATVPQDFVWGNGTTDLTESSTSLNNTLLTESIVTLTQLSPGVVLSEHTLQAADLSGFDLTEFGTVDSAGNLLHGTTFAPRPKPNDEIWDGRDIVRFTN